MKAILLVSHGSRAPEAVKEILQLAGRLKEKCGSIIVEPAFLEINTPAIAEGIKKCADQGAGEILILLNFLNAGNHVSKDIPAIIEKARGEYPNIHFQISEHLGVYEGIDDVFINIIRKQGRFVS